MAEGGGGSVKESGGRSKPASVCESAGGRIRLRVELRPGETTIVSWKKLLREANLSDPGGPNPSVSGPSIAERQDVVQPPPPNIPALPPPSRQLMEKDPKDSQAQAGSSRLSTVIERIERMYAGDGSSDEEAGVLDNVPYDDEYDTSDSFIDDAELDEYFQVDNSAIKHDGFFVNRGKLDRIETTIPKDQEPKKRKRKNLAKSHLGTDGGSIPNKIAKVGDTGKKQSSLLEASLGVAVLGLNAEAVKFPGSTANVSEVFPKKKSVNAPANMDPLGRLGVDAERQYKETDQRMPEIIHPASYKSSVDSLSCRSTEASLGVALVDLNGEAVRCRDSLANGPEVSLKKKAANAAVTVNPLGLSSVDANKKHKETELRKHEILSLANQTFSTDSLSHTFIDTNHRREGSSGRPKSMMLDKAIKDLEKIVAEFRPPSTEVQDPDNSFQAVKKRLPPEIKVKLAKVARLAQSNGGTIPKDVISRLMGIVGHLMQVRTLKRNLKLMVKIGLAAKQEKHDRIQRIKQEIVEMVKQQASNTKPKVNQDAANSDGIQENAQEKKDGLKHIYRLDEVLENKFCDLYDVYLEGLDEDTRPSVRRLYEELAVLLPSGFMDVDGLRRAIHRAKERRGLSNPFKREKIRKKRPLAQEEEEEDRGSIALTHIRKKKLALESHERGFSSGSRPTTISHFRPHSSPASSNDSRVDKMNLDKAKGSPIISPIDVAPKKKVKKKPTSDAIEAQYRLKKLSVSLSEEQQNQQKLLALSKPNCQPGGGSL